VDGQDFADIEAVWGGAVGWPKLALALQAGDIPTGAGSDACSYRRPTAKLQAAGHLDRGGIGVCMTGSDAGAGADSSKPDLPPEIYAYRAGRNAQQAAVEVEELLFRGHPESRGTPTSRTTFGSIPHSDLLKVGGAPCR